MRIPSSRMPLVCLCVAAVGVGVFAQAVPTSPRRKPIDLHSAIALSQAELYGTTGPTARADRTAPAADVLLLIAEPQWAAVRARLVARGMTIQFEDAKSGYMRVTAPFADVRLLFEWPEIEAVRVDGSAGFDTHLQPQDLRSTLGFSDPHERAPVSEDPAPSTNRTARPVLTRELARRYPLNPDQDMRVTEFRAAHPTFDGRGVGIGVLETTWLALDHPALSEARALDGTMRRKVLRFPAVPATRAEGTSARFSDWFECKSTICEIGGRTMRLPTAGRYRRADFSLVWPLPFGCRELTTLPIVQRAETSRFYFDRNRDLDFLDEPPIVDFNSATWDARSIVSFACGNAQPLKAVITADDDGQFVRLHPFNTRHVTMVSSVAAGSDVENNLAVGVAPNASLIMAETGSGESILSQYLESAIALLRDPDVDLMVVSSAIQTPLGTSDSFDTRAFDRMSDAYNKPIVISAGNNMTALAAVPQPSGRLTMAVGQYVNAAMTEALRGVKRAEVPVVASTVGPAWDGASRPDFIAASKRIAAFPCVQGKRVNATQFDLPACYSISGGTSAASPSAGGVVALLLSAAKQRGLTPSPADIREAVIASAHVMPGLPLHTQGAGLIDVSRAWEYLQQPRRATSVTIEGELRHPFVDFLGGAPPKGLFWIARSNQRETLALTVRQPLGTDPGSLSVQSKGDLDLTIGSQTRTSTFERVPVTMAPPTLGRVASSWITVADAIGTTVARVLATAVRPAALSTPDYTYEWLEEVEIETHRGTVVTIPTGASGVLIEHVRSAGDVVPVASSPIGALVMPRTFWSGTSIASIAIHRPGRYANVLLDPAGGDWGIAPVEYSTVRSNAPTTTEASSVSFRVTAFRTLCAMMSASRERLQIAVQDLFATPLNGGALVAPATIRTERFTLRDEFERRPVTIDVKPGTALFHVSMTNTLGRPIMLQLFDCTSGHCIPVIQSVPGDLSPVLNVRQPVAGVWRVFAVPIRQIDTPTDVELTVTQALEANVTALTPLTSKPTSRGQVFEGTVPSAEPSSRYVLLRTDERAKINKEGWGAVSVSVCSTQDTPHRR